MLSELKKEQFHDLFQLFEESFPQDEYRPYELQKALLSLPQYKVYVYEKDHVLGGFFATWEGPSFIFIEHFAVKESFRNNGLGSRLLQEFVKLAKKPIVLEVEPPKGDLQKRRVAFYERNGFKLNQWSYLQPALAKDQKPVPLVLMSYPRALEPKEFQLFKNWVFSLVYS